MPKLPKKKKKHGWIVFIKILELKAVILFLKWAAGGREFETRVDSKLSFCWLTVVKSPFLSWFLWHLYWSSSGTAFPHFWSFALFKNKEESKMLFVRGLCLEMDALSVVFGSLAKRLRLLHLYEERSERIHFLLSCCFGYTPRTGLYNLFTLLGYKVFQFSQMKWHSLLPTS